MGTVAPPNIVEAAQQISQNPLTEQARAVQLQGEQQQVKQQQIQTQMQQQQLQDQQAMTKAMQSWDGKDFSQLPELMRQNGISAPGYINAQNSILQRRQQLLSLDKSQLEDLDAHHDAALGVLNQAKDIPDEQLSSWAATTGSQLQAANHLTPQEAQTFLQHSQSMPPAQFRPWLDVYEKGLKGEKEQIAEVSKTAEIAANNAKAIEDAAKARAENATAAHQEFINNLTKNSKPGDYYKQIDAIFDPNDPKTAGSNRMTKAQVDGAISRGDVEAAKQFVDQAFQNVQAINKDIAVQTNPDIQHGKEAVAYAEGQGRASIEAAAARGNDPAVADVPAKQVLPAKADYQKANADFAQNQAVTQRLNAMMQAAKSGNVIAYQIIPEEGTLQITTSQGVHRINMAEIQQYAGGGSLWQRMQGHFGRALTGASIPNSVLDDMAAIQKIQQEGSQQKYKNTVDGINQTYGSKFKPLNLPAQTQQKDFFQQFDGKARQ